MSPGACSEGEDVSETDSSSNGIQAMSVSTSSDKNLSLDGDHDSEGAGAVAAADFEFPGGAAALSHSLLARKHVIEPDPDSIASDYSELAGPIKEHLANVQIIQREDLQSGNTMFANQFTVQQKITRGADETEEEFTKRLRKINYLSLAQEFAELKKIDSSALPFDLHKGQGQGLDDSSPVSELSSETDSDKYNADSALATPMETQKDFGEDVSRKLQEMSISGETQPVLPPGEQVENRKAEMEALNGIRINKEGPDNVKSSEGKVDPNKDETDSPIVVPSRNTNTLSRSMSEGTRTSNSVLEKGIQDSTIPESGKNKSESADDLHDFDVYNIETTLPQMDWAMLEHQLLMAAEEEKEKKKSRRNDREEIRRRLAMGTDEDYYGGERAYKKPNLQTRLQSGMNLQICFVNESTLDSDLANVGKVTAAGDVDTSNANVVASVSDTVARQSPPLQSTSSTAAQKPTGSGSSSAKKPTSSSGTKTGDGPQDFNSRQAQLQAEARMALAQVRPMAHMQLEVEKQMKKKSPLAEIVGIPGIGDGKRTKFHFPMLNEMNLAQIQVLVNDLHSQIESLNEDLVQFLINRDDLHMEQDSMLVDIEDHTRRAQEATTKQQTKAKKKKVPTATLR